MSHDDIHSAVSKEPGAVMHRLFRATLEQRLCMCSLADVEDEIMVVEAVKRAADLVRRKAIFESILSAGRRP